MKAKTKMKNQRKVSKHHSVLNTNKIKLKQRANRWIKFAFAFNKNLLLFCFVCFFLSFVWFFPLKNAIVLFWDEKCYKLTTAISVKESLSRDFELLYNNFRQIELWFLMLRIWNSHFHQRIYYLIFNYCRSYWKILLWKVTFVNSANSKIFASSADNKNFTYFTKKYFNLSRGIFICLTQF